jgi:hypothetical protein
MEISLEGDRHIDVHTLLFQDKCPLVSSQELLRGKVRVVAPAGRSVWHDGISIQLDWSLSFFESLSTKESTAYKAEICKAGYLSGETLVPFEIDLRSVSDSLLEAYDGEMFCVRHSLLVDIKRPWWTFNVLRSLVLAVHKVEPAPLAEEHVLNDDLALRKMYAPAPAPAQPPAAPGAGAEPTALDAALADPASELAGADGARVHMLRVVDAARGLWMTYERSCLNIGDTFRGTVHLGGGLPGFLRGKIEPHEAGGRVVTVELVLYKIETGENDSSEIIVRVVPVDLGQGGAPAAAAAQAGDAELVAAEAAHRDAQRDERHMAPEPAPASLPEPPSEEVRLIPVELPLTNGPQLIELSPTIVDEVVSVRYFVRLVARDEADRAIWNTHEVVLYRAGLISETI